jgi:hypothetical protein
MADFVVLVRPPRFYGNPITAATNEFQQTADCGDGSADVTTRLALEEHRALEDALRSRGVPCEVFVWGMHELEKGSVKPDSIFPNNSFSFHLFPEEQGGASTKVIVYPMSAGRLDEIPSSLLGCLLRHPGAVDLRLSDRVLEGTGALVFSPCGRFMYVSLSSRADADLAVQMVAERELKLAGSSVFLFRVVTAAGTPVYHTNVIMWTAQGVCAVCLEGIAFPDESALAPAENEAKRVKGSDRDRFLSHLSTVYEHVLALSLDEVRSFCGNCYELRAGPLGLQRLLCLSQTAWNGFSVEHRALLSRLYPGGDAQLLIVPIPTIEKCGGGSLRCLMAVPIVHMPIMPLTRDAEAKNREAAGRAMASLLQSLKLGEP